MAISDLKTVLILENEALIALDLEGMLLSTGAGHVHHVVSSSEALAWLHDNKPELAILDIFVKDGPSTAVADKLREQSIPFLVHSGHARHGSGYGDAFKDAVWLSKPCTESDLMLAIDQALGQALGLSL